MLRVKAGDLDRMGLLFERYHRQLFGFLYHMLGRADTSEDLVQNVFYRMLKYRHTDVAGLSEHLGGGARADEGLEHAQDVALLHQALARLTPDNREILVLSRFQELKYAEIARVLNTTEGAVKVRIHRAMNELKAAYLRIEN